MYLYIRISYIYIDIDLKVASSKASTFTKAGNSEIIYKYFLRESYAPSHVSLRVMLPCGRHVHLHTYTL